MSKPTSPEWGLTAHPAAQRELDDAPEDARERLRAILHAIKTERDPLAHPSIEKIQADEAPRLHRIRAGDYRALIHHEPPDIVLLSVENRRKDYRALETAITRLH